MSDSVSFTDKEQLQVRSVLRKRWDKGEVSIQIVDVDMRVADSEEENTECPAIYWDASDYHFLLMKVAENKFRPQFFYQDSEEAGAVELEFDDIAECAMALLKMQANHAIAAKEAANNAE